MNNNDRSEKDISNMLSKAENVVDSTLKAIDAKSKLSQLKTLSSKSKSKARFSLPGKMIDALFYDNDYIQSISKIKNFENTFPKQYQWYEDDGLYIEMTLAGYSPDDISIIAKGNNSLIISSDGMGAAKSDSQKEITLDINEVLDILKSESLDSQDLSDEQILHTKMQFDNDEYPKKVANSSLNKGLINRGAARRRFETSLFFEGDLDVNGAKASMEHGLLRIFIPGQEVTEKSIKIN